MIQAPSPILRSSSTITRSNDAWRSLAPARCSSPFSIPLTGCSSLVISGRERTFQSGSAESRALRNLLRQRNLIFVVVALPADGNTFHNVAWTVEGKAEIVEKIAIRITARTPDSRRSQLFEHSLARPEKLDSSENRNARLKGFDKFEPILVIVIEVEPTLRVGIGQGLRHRRFLERSKFRAQKRPDVCSAHPKSEMTEAFERSDLYSYAQRHLFTLLTRALPAPA